MMTTPSGDPYQYGDDTVAARLEVDIPAEAINNLADLSKHTADIRANMEATAKYNQDYVQYLRELPSVIGEVDSAQSRMSQSRSAIFGGETIIPDDRTPTATFADGQAGAGRALRAVDEDTLIGLARNNPRQVANMAADRGLDDYFEDTSHIIPRPPPGPGPSPRSGRGRQFAGGGRPPATPTSPRYGTSPGDDNGRAASESPGRQVTPEGTESQAERAAARLLEELERKDSEAPDFINRVRGAGESFQNNPFLNYLTTEGGTRGRSDAIGFAGGLGRMAQQSGEGLLERQAAAEAEQSNLLQTAANVAQLNPDMADQLRKRAAGMSGRLGGMARLAPLAKGAGVAGAAVAGVAAINAGVQKTGEWAHEMQGVGGQMGGGFSEGLAFESQIRTMAMNPFISTEQSRRIMQEALQSGYTGKEMDTMTDFMAENLKNMNIEVAESAKLLQQNVLKGGQDTATLQAQLSQNAAMAGETNLSTNQINEFFGRHSGALIDRGADATAAGASAQVFSTLYEDNAVLREDGRDLVEGLFLNNRTFQSYFRESSGAAAQGIPTAAMPRWATNNMSSGEVAGNSIDALSRMIQPYMAGYTSGDPARVEEAILGAASFLKTTPNVAEELLQDFASDRAFSRAEENEEMWESQGGGELNTNMTNIPIVEDVAWLGQKARNTGSFIRMGWNMVTGDMEQATEVKENYQARRAHQRLDATTRGQLTYTYTPEILEQLAIQEHSGKLEDVTIVDEEGNERNLSTKDLQNKEFMEKLQSGDVSVKTEEHGVQTLREWGNTQATDDAGSGGSYTVELGPYARQFFNLDGPNPVQRQADAGTTERNSSEAGQYPYGSQGGGN